MRLQSVWGRFEHSTGLCFIFKYISWCACRHHLAAGEVVVDSENEGEDHGSDDGNDEHEQENVHKELTARQVNAPTPQEALLSSP